MTGTNAMIRSGKAARLMIALVVLSVGYSGCRRAPDEEQVRQAVAALSRSAEAGSVAGVTALLSVDFDGNAGELDRRSLGNMVRIVAMRGESIGVITGPISIEHRGERMVAAFDATLTNRSRLLPEQLGLYHVQSAWRREHGEWRCYWASWKHVL
ncbi:MAG: hypothetical protein ABI386_02000 [Rhodanobacter sp.]